MARWTKKLIKDQLDWSNECFHRALLDCNREFLSEKEQALPLSDLKTLIHLDWREQVVTPEVNALYLKYMCQMSSERLSLILEANQKGKQRRGAITIDAIMTELFERSTNSETRGIHEQDS